MPNKQLTSRKVKNTNFHTLYKRLILEDELSNQDRVKLLSCAILFMNQSDKVLKKLAYKIILRYTNQYNDHAPLYDYSINLGLIPVAKIIQESEEGNNSEKLIDLVAESYISTFTTKNITMTAQQELLSLFLEKNKGASSAIIAPTSYGKSDLIIKSLNDGGKDDNSCILVPSKALLSQTKRRIKDENIEWLERIVTHPEMHKDNKKGSVYILTQERFLRLVSQNKDLYFDNLYIDEAHNLLDSDHRSKLLSMAISIAYKRNPLTSIKLFTPALNDPKNLNVRFSQIINDNFIVEESVKSETYYLTDFRKSGQQLIYDQHINEFIETNNKPECHISYVKENASGKDIIYFNKPKSIELFTRELIGQLDPVDCQEINEAVSEISNSVDVDYNLIDCLKKGVVYHHGSMSDNVRNYVEHLFRSSRNVRFLVSSSTLLEGVNLPIKTLFLFDNKKGRRKLSPSQMKNLVGRVNRFSEIFNPATPNKLLLLEPQIHLVGTHEYMASNSNLRSFLNETTNEQKDKIDKPENILLENTEINNDNKVELEDSMFELECIEPGVIEDYQGATAKTEIGRLLTVNSIDEINTQKYEDEISDLAHAIEDKSINSTEQLTGILKTLFMDFVENERSDMFRLKNTEAMSFYRMLIDWRLSKTPLKLLIKKFTGYWSQLIKDNPETIVYVGKWGERSSAEGFREHYVQMSEKTEKEKVNLAIVRIKEEEDFIDNKIFRFIEVLNDLNLINDDFYKELKYGSTDATVISLIKSGLSRSVSELLIKKYSDSFSIDDDEDVTLRKDLPKLMSENNESIFSTFEVEMNA